MSTFYAGFVLLIQLSSLRVAYSCLPQSIITDEIKNTHRAVELDASPCHQQELQPARNERMYIGTQKPTKK
jgi:hypothetical protein